MGEAAPHEYVAAYNRRSGDPNGESELVRLTDEDMAGVADTGLRMALSAKSIILTTSMCMLSMRIQMIRSPMLGEYEKNP